MASTLHIPASTEIQSNIHWLPIKISTTKVEEFEENFKVQSVQQDGDAPAVLIAALRGRQLRGCKQDLPEGYQGLILSATETQHTSVSQDNDAMHDDELDQDRRKQEGAGPSKSWTATAQFQSVHYWNHDNAPSRTDHLKRVFDWLSIAKTVHQPVSVSQVEEQVKKLKQTASS